VALPLFVAITGLGLERSTILPETVTGKSGPILPWIPERRLKRLTLPQALDASSYKQQCRAHNPKIKANEKAILRRASD